MPSLSFDASFESANLMRAVQVRRRVAPRRARARALTCNTAQVGKKEYDLVLRPDVHTQHYTQWFYFAVGGTHVPALKYCSDCPKYEDWRAERARTRGR